MSDWLQKELAANLAAVEAPDGLEERVLRPRVSIPARRVSAVLIAAAMLVLSAGTVWLSGRQPERIAPARWKANDHNCVLCHTV